MTLDTLEQERTQDISQRTSNDPLEQALLAQNQGDPMSDAALEPQSSPPEKKGKWIQRISQISAVVIIIGITVGLVELIMLNKPETKRVTIQQPGPLVVVEQVQAGSYPINVTGFGSIQARRTAMVIPQVSGRVKDIHPQLVAGGFIAKGSTLVKIDDEEYLSRQQSAQANLERAQAMRQQAEANLLTAKAQESRAKASLQRGQANIERAKASVDKAVSALRTAEASLRVAQAEADASIAEWKLDQPGTPVPPLVAREPQLAQAKAAVDSAKADVNSAETELGATRTDIDSLKADVAAAQAGVKTAEANIDAAQADISSAQAALAQAVLNVKRTNITLPFDAIVSSENVEEGQLISSAQSIAEVYDPKELEVSIPLHDRDLAWFKYASVDENGKITPGASVDLSMETEKGELMFKGNVIRTENDVDPIAQTVNVVIRIDLDASTTNSTQKSQLKALLLRPGAFVKANIKGEKLTGVYRLPRAAIRGDGQIWVIEEGEARLGLPLTPELPRDVDGAAMGEMLSTEKTNNEFLDEAFLQIHSVTVLRTDANWVYLSEGVKPGDLVITSSLDVVTENMRVRPRITEETEAETQTETGTGTGTETDKINDSTSTEAKPE